MVKIVGLRNLSRLEIQEVVFENEGIQLEAVITSDFPNESKEPQLPLSEIQKIIDSYSETKLSAAISNFKLASESAFVRGYLFVLALALTKSRKVIRKPTIEFLFGAFNAFTRPSSLVSAPQNILKVFYGECDTVESLAKASIAPIQLTKSEVDLILSNIQTSYVSALTLVSLNNIKNVLKLSSVSFALFCESNYINTEQFLVPFTEKRCLSRQISLLATEVQNLLYGSRLSKKKANQDVVSWVEIAGSVRNGLQQLWDYFADELAVESEGDSGASKGLIEVELKQYVGLNSQLLNLQGNVNLLTANVLRRQLNSEDQDKSLISQVENLLSQVQTNNVALDFNAMTVSAAAASTKLGDNFVLLLSFDKLIHLLQEATQIEFFVAVQVLDKLNKQLLANKKPAKEEKDNEKNKKKKEVKLLQLGKGTDIIFNETVEKYNFQIEGAVQTVLKEIQATYTISNKDLLAQSEELFAPRNEERRKPKIPKGTRDFNPLQMAIKRKVFKIIQSILLQHGAVEIDTPIFELKETLTGKYGNDSKLIYDLDDQGGELLSLRYDLTVPFARYLASQSITNFKRFHIAKVYRRDQPNMTKGRYREFYQCDIDIAGNYGLMIPDAEIIKVVNDILQALELGSPFSIKVNSRKILDAMIEIAGAPSSKFKTICSSIDKLDKEPWSEVRRELIEDKGLSVEIVEKLGEFVEFKGAPIEILAKLRDAKLLDGSKVGAEGLQEMGLLFEYLEALDCLKNISFDLSLARGLDYYTGMIYEAVLEGASIGSIGGGGRYDGLIGMFSSKQIPSVGGSVGIERVFNILEEQYTKKLSIRSTETEFLICTVGSGLVKEKLKLINEFWGRGLKAEIIYSENPKPQKQLEYALENQIPFMIWLGEEELQGGFVKIKCTYTKLEEKCERGLLFKTLEEKLAQYYEDLASEAVVYKIETAN